MTASPPTYRTPPSAAAADAASAAATAWTAATASATTTASAATTVPTPATSAAASPALLAFDTATERASIGVAAHGRLWQREIEGGGRASALFLPEVLGLLAAAGIELGALDAIAFGRGPGAFTGLRVACAVAQGLAFGATKPVLPIDTLLAVAEDARAGASTLRVWAVIDARMDEIYAAEYAFGAASEGVETGGPAWSGALDLAAAKPGWRCVVEPHLSSVEALNARWREAPPSAVAGNALGAFGARLECGAARRFAGAAPRPGGLLTLAQRAWALGQAIDPALALPLYLRDKVAQTTVEREATRRSRTLNG